MRKIRVICAALLCTAVLTVTAAAAGTAGNLERTLSQIGALWQQCDLGNATADAVRKATGADLAILPGELFYMNLPGGDVTEEQLGLSYSGDPEIGVCTVTPAQLKELLEIGVSHIETDESDRIAEEQSVFNGYPQLSGITVKADYSAPPKDRILTITLENGTALDLEDQTTRLTMAATAELLSGGYGYPEQKTCQGCGYGLIACVRQALSEGTLAAPDKSRLEVIGIQGNIYLQNVSPSIFVLVLAVMLLTAAVSTSVKRPSRE